MPGGSIVCEQGERGGIEVISSQAGRSRWRMWLWTLFGTVLLSGAAVWTATKAATVLNAPRHTAPDVLVAGIGLKGMDRREASARLLDSPVRLERVTWLVDGLLLEHEVSLRIDVEPTLDAAFAHGRSADLWERFKAWRTPAPSQEIGAVWKVAGGETHRIAELLRPFVSRAATDAELQHSGDRIWIEPDALGRALDDAALARQMAEVVRGINRFHVPVSATPAAVTEQSLKRLGVTDLRGKVTTYYDAGNRPRTNNILVASRTIGEVMLAPGEVFSFNQRVGQRTVGRGYQVAQVILADALVPGLGGGICQVSSTLYAAAVQAGVTVLDRTNHSLPIWYMEPGLDATVSWGGPDLVLRNDTGQSLLVTVTNDPLGALTVRFFGPQGGNDRLQSIVLETYPYPVHVTEDPALPAGHEVVDQAGQQGVKAALYSLSGSERKLVNLSVYNPYPRKIRRGPKPPSPPSGADEGGSSGVAATPGGVSPAIPAAEEEDAGDAPEPPAPSLGE